MGTLANAQLQPCAPPHPTFTACFLKGTRKDLEGFDFLALGCCPVLGLEMD